MWNVFVGLAVTFLLAPAAPAQMYPMACAPQVKKTLLTEQNICSDDACRKSLQKARELIRTLKSPDERAMLKDLDYLKVALLLKSDSRNKSHENLIEKQIKVSRSALRLQELFKERYEAHKREPRLAAAIDENRLVLLKQENQLIEKKLIELSRAASGEALVDGSGTKDSGDEPSKSMSKLLMEQNELKSEIQMLEQMPYYLAVGDSIPKLIATNIHDMKFELQFLETTAQKEKSLYFSDLDSWSLWYNYESYKFTLTKLRNRSTFRDCGLLDSELYAVYYYTGDGYRSMNRALHGKTQDSSALTWIDILKGSLSKLKNNAGIVKRGGKLTQEQVQQYQKGREIVFPAFMSASMTEGLDSQFSFTVRSLKGKYIAPLSSVPTEEEVLFLPGTKFKVIDVKGKEYFLEEMP